MKVLKPLVSLLVLCSSLVYALDDTKKLDSYISKNKNDQFQSDYDKNEAESSKLRDSWIAPLNLNYTYSKSDPYDNKQTQENAGIYMDQAIFKSGGIYYGIKYAQASRKYGNYSVDVSKRTVVKDAVSLLMQIKQTSLKEIKQELQISNSQISLDQKKEHYLNGQLDSGFLNNAIIEKNVVTQTLYDIKTNKERLISKFKAISDMPYNQLSIPYLKDLTQDEFIDNNIVLSMNESERERNGYNKNVTIAKYLPSVNFVAGYNWQKSQNQSFFSGSGTVSQETSYYNYGIKANLPLDINTFRDIEVSKLDYLKSQLVVEDNKRELIAIYEQVMQNIENLENKKVLSKENSDLYEALLAETTDLYNAGYKTKYDVDLLKNSLEIQNLDVQIYEIDKQLELLTLYEMYKKD